MEYRFINRWELHRLAEELGVPFGGNEDVYKAISACYWIGRMHEKRNQETHGKEKSKDDK